jgi:hypothetical protein
MGGYELPDVIWLEILTCLTLAHLRALKAVSREMATHCRHVLRSEKWQNDGGNAIDLRYELKATTRQPTFPFTVSILDEYFGGPGCRYGYDIREGDGYVLATVHSMDIAFIDDDGNRVERAIGLKAESKNNELHSELVDVCIEVHGQGIFASELGLRIMLQALVVERGTSGWPKSRYSSAAQRISGWEIVDEDDGTQSRSIGDTEIDEMMTTIELLQHMNVMTETAKGKWMQNEMVCSDEGYALTVLNAMRLKLGAFA